MTIRRLGDQELEVLSYIADRAPAAAREIADGFGDTRGLARTTVLTIIERLRQKGYLTRTQVNGVFQYSPRVPQADVMHDVVRQFVEKTLGGSVSPVVAYLSRGRSLSKTDIDELQNLVNELKSAEVEESDG